jgi:hypothetical protein
MTVKAEHYQKNEKIRFSTYFSNSNSMIKDLFRGVGSLMIRQMVAWIYFL